MKAAVLVAPMQFDIRDVPIPECGAFDVLIKVERCGICGTDLHIYHGNYSRDRLPLIPGHEFSGTIAAIGDAVQGFTHGQRVTADINLGCRSCFYCRKNEILNCPQRVQLGIHVDGGMAEYVRVPAHAVVPLPPDMPVEQGTMVEPLSCIVRAFRKSHLRLGESVLVIGGGPIGQLHLQLALRAGAAPVILVEPNPQRAALGKELGADHVVSDIARADDLVRAVTNGRGVDIAIESVGSPQLYEQAFTLIRPGGRVIAFGLAKPEHTFRIAALDFVLREQGIQASVAGMGDDMHEAATLLGYRRVDVAPFLTTIYRLDDVQDAFARLAEDRSVLKIQLQVA
ncbi:zinc-binding dehydrogenase [Paraburkholderia sp. JPY432]|uniref:zinc-dependent alcohol dehydrogenase n=1 Tax=Paraburkholderia youngii TaxID=2782701 RepID=UPI0015959A41|nr:alcohol dehydrogenase catalytic domain-containing protein [Paraburkholderia youngii]NVH74108.1 zinc-binding dehydrogenase [Paraburkholderia youngii]